MPTVGNVVKSGMIFQGFTVYNLNIVAESYVVRVFKLAVVASLLLS